jgi:hypothetical protein
VAFPTITDADFDPDPCNHFFPYTMVDGRTDASPCEKCGALWADRDKGFRGCRIWSLPKEVSFGTPVASAGWLPLGPGGVEPDPGWFSP